MTKNTEMPRMTSVAPLIDQLQEIAIDEIPAPRTCSVKLWDDSDFHIVIYHERGPDEKEGIYYDVETSEVVWEYVKNGEWIVDEEAEASPEYGIAYKQKYEQSETRVITTIDPPVEVGDQ